MGELPANWKISTIAPLLKPGRCKYARESHRPVALTSSAAKIAERVISVPLLSIAVDDGEQPAYKKKRGREDAVGRVVRLVDSARRAGRGVVALMIDLKSAFDRAEHPYLLSVLLRNMDEKGQLSDKNITTARWIRNFLADRVFKVRCGGALSNPNTSEVGVPQGTQTGPLAWSVCTSPLL